MVLIWSWIWIRKTCCVDVELEQIEKRFERKCANRER